MDIANGKVYDAIVTVRVDGRDAMFALEYERTVNYICREGFCSRQKLETSELRSPLSDRCTGSTLASRIRRFFRLPPEYCPTATEWLSGKKSPQEEGLDRRASEVSRILQQAIGAHSQRHECLTGY